MKAVTEDIFSGMMLLSEIPSVYLGSFSFGVIVCQSQV